MQHARFGACEYSAINVFSRNVPMECSTRRKLSNDVSSMHNRADPSKFSASNLPGYVLKVYHNVVSSCLPWSYPCMTDSGGNETPPEKGGVSV